jgi:hypothetical protein
MIQAQAYWHLKGLAVDLVILNEDPSGLPPSTAGADTGTYLPPESARTPVTNKDGYL